MCLDLWRAVTDRHQAVLPPLFTRIRRRLQQRRSKKKQQNQHQHRFRLPNRRRRHVEVMEGCGYGVIGREGVLNGGEGNSHVVFPRNGERSGDIASGVNSPTIGVENKQYRRVKVLEVGDDDVVDNDDNDDDVVAGCSYRREAGDGTEQCDDSNPELDSRHNCSSQARTHFLGTRTVIEETYTGHVAKARHDVQLPDSQGGLDMDTIDLTIDEEHESPHEEDTNERYVYEGVVDFTDTGNDVIIDDDDLLTLESLLTMTPVHNDSDVVRHACRHLCLSHVQNQPAVHDLFFPMAVRHPMERRIDPEWFDFERFAVLYICDALVRCNDPYGIRDMLRSDTVKLELVDYYTGPQWKKIGFALYTQLFPDLVRDSLTMVPFRAYMEDDRHYWASRIMDQLRDSQWLYQLMQPVVQGQCDGKQYNRDMNILFVKLHLLDPTLVFPAFTQLRKALPDLNMELVTTNYLGEPFDWRDIKPNVEGAVSTPTLPSNAPRFTMEDYELYFGVQVTEFIMQLPREMGLWSGSYPENKRVSTLRDRCVLM